MSQPYYVLTPVGEPSRSFWMGVFCGVSLTIATLLIIALVVFNVRSSF